MSAFVCAASAMSVAALYCSWRSYQEKIIQRQQQLCQRVAYMLWVMAHSMPEPE